MVVFFSFLKIPTQKGEHSYKCTEYSLKRKEGIIPTTNEIREESILESADSRLVCWREMLCLKLLTGFKSSK